VLAHMHPAYAPFAPQTRPCFEGRLVPVLSPGATLEPPSAQSPFAPMSVLPPLGGVVSRLLGGRYPSFIAPTGSCAEPLPSVRLWFPSCVRSLQVAASPCCAMALPDVISANLSPRARTPTPAASKVHSLVSSLRALAFPD
jgi:hypothetical protein